MIGREDPVKPFELIRWARDQATRCQLGPLEAHVLLVLATYANGDATAWPSIKTLALDCGLRPTKDGTNSSVSAAIARLEDLQLVWTKQGGHGHSARRELLFNPSQPSGRQDGSPPANESQPSDLPDGCDFQPSGRQDASHPAGRMRTTRNGQGTANDERPKENGQKKPSCTQDGFTSADQDGNEQGLTGTQRRLIAQLGRRAVQINADAEAAA